MYNRKKKILKDMFKEAILKVEECTNLQDTVYNYNFSYVKESIETIEMCFETYEPENVLVAFNGGKDCMVLLHLTLAVLKRNYSDRNLRPLCLYVQSADPFEELEEFVEHCRQFYNLNLLKFSTKVKDALEFVLKSKPNIKACLMGTRRDDPFAFHLKAFQMTDPNWPQIMRVSPLLDWHYSFIWDYLLDLQVPYCKLYDQGYTSIGSRLNTKLNPYLYYHDPKQNIKKYLPAYKLLDVTKERSGRC
ncbi:FAD synthase-like isoform X2 [Agrilus planipennis]|uniref:FAD synthase n=1 Tax=Agrilus planipennis TaxID=224129 RepID=A0A7F5R666_AGRPL|nr:FAD synthase-like isoform X2 [Agrilus planipennis]